nr:MAG TPA: hypothetical protein [Caudoviricetes sp.]
MTRQHHDDNAHEKLTASHGLSANGSPGGTRHHNHLKIRNSSGRLASASLFFK